MVQSLAFGVIGLWVQISAISLRYNVTLDEWRLLSPVVPFTCEVMQHVESSLAVNNRDLKHQ